MRPDTPMHYVILAVGLLALALVDWRRRIWKRKALGCAKRAAGLETALRASAEREARGIEARVGNVARRMAALAAQRGG